MKKWIIISVLIFGGCTTNPNKNSDIKASDTSMPATGNNESIMNNDTTHYNANDSLLTAP